MSSPEVELDRLWQGVCDPPDDARPRAWWHWMDGNIDPEGILADLAWLARVGVRGVQLFDGAMGTPLVVPERVRHGSPAWQDAVRLAASTANRLGLEFAVATSAGWSAAGAPWVEPAEAMKKLVWSRTPVTGGRRAQVQLAALPDVAGPYQDCPRWGADPEAHRYVEDWVTVAVPAEQVPEVCRPSAVLTEDGPVTDWSVLVDGRFGESLTLPRDPDRASTVWVEQVFDEPVEVGAVTIGLPGPRGFAAAPPPHAVLEVREETGDEAAEVDVWRPVAELAEPTVPAGQGVPVRTVAFPAVRGRRFRLVLSGPPAAAGLPPLADGVRPPPIVRRSEAFWLSEFALLGGGRVHLAEVKAGFAAALDEQALLASPVAGPSPVIDPARVVDLTDHVDPDGVLRWEAPPGRWCVLRLGASLTGATNGPAAPEATGLEVDKLDAAAVRRYLHTHLARFDAALAAAGDAEGPPGLDALLADSIESGPQNHTRRLRERFTAMRGYDPLPWLPALAGFVVADPDRTDRFLRDHRRTIADLLTDAYYGTLTAVAHERGLTSYAEALEDHRPQLGDDLAMRSRVDVPMGAMWVFDPGEQPRPTYLADLRGASSVAHVYGKAYTGAESFTAFHRPWSETPRRLKHVADLELALGVTRFCLHTSPHQPSQVPPPGIALSPHLGQAFVRTEPWAELAGAWIDYLARGSWLLNQGLPAVDVLVFVGEESPLTATFGEVPDRTVPPPLGFDHVDLLGLEERITVHDGELVAGAPETPSARYRVLAVADGCDRLTARAVRRLAELAEAGAVVAGARPVGTPSLADDPGEYAALCDRVWGSGLVRDAALPVVLADLGVRPWLTIEAFDPAVGEPSLHRIGRRTAAGELVFLANPAEAGVTVTLRTAEAAQGLDLVAWDLVSLRRIRLPRNGSDGHRLTLPPLGSAVVVAGGPAEEPDPVPDVVLALDGAWQLALPDGAAFAWPDGPQPWTALDGAAAVTGTYRTSIELDADWARARRVVLDLADVGDLARVRVNDVDCGVTWTAPFRLEVTHAVRDGPNVIEVEVATAWMNRLIAEAAEPTGQVFAPAAAVYRPEASRRSAGLLGPARLVRC